MCSCSSACLCVHYTLLPVPLYRPMCGHRNGSLLTRCVSVQCTAIPLSVPCVPAAPLVTLSLVALSVLAAASASLSPICARVCVQAIVFVEGYLNSDLIQSNFQSVHVILASAPFPAHIYGQKAVISLHSADRSIAFRIRLAYFFRKHYFVSTYPLTVCFTMCSR